MLSFKRFYPLLQDFMYNKDGMSQQMGDESQTQ